MKATRRTTLRNLYNLFKDKYYPDLYIKSLVNGRFTYMPIKTVVDKGVKDCVKIQLEDTELICTPDHLILTTNGWVGAKDLKSNDIVLTNGQLVCKNCGSTRDICKAPYGKFFGYCRTCMYKLRNGTKYKDDNIVREVNSEGYVVLKGKGTRDFPSYRRRYGMGVLEHDHIMEMYLGRPLDITKECVHHINGIKTDNRLENLQLMTVSEHAKLHQLGGNHNSNLIQFDTTKTHYIKGNTTIWLAPKQSKVISINKTQPTHVYDVEIADNEIHNFVANCVVVHNCGKTLQAITIARYKEQHSGLKHCLIVCGVNSLKYNWQREVEKFCKDEKAIILGTRVNKKGKVVPITVEETKQQIQSCPKEFFWIINIERIRYDSSEFKKGTSIVNYFNKLIQDKELGMLILDEAHKCFPGNTKVMTDVGQISIEEIVKNKLDRKCLSLNVKTNALEFKDIVDWHIISSKDKLLHLTFDNGVELSCTPDHRIYTLNRGYVMAQDLKEADRVVCLND